jgi:hypothetical protein
MIIRIFNYRLPDKHAGIHQRLSEGGYLVMFDGIHINVSRSRKEILLQKLQPSRLLEGIAYKARLL